ncbi:MAG: hypothetical protein IPP32_15650 [Bacteroidetes bacterium]|nr:hypothetical protein [Bacteroidota bacterium]
MLFRALLIILVLHISSLTSFAKVTFCKGYYITLNGDSVSCTFTIPTDRSINIPIYLELQKSVIAIVESTQKKQRFKPKQLKKYAFTFDTLNLEFESIPFGKKNAKIFVKKSVSGYLSIYEYYSENEVRPQNFGSGMVFAPYNRSYVGGPTYAHIGIYQNFLMQKRGALMVFIDGLNFKAEMSNYFTDAPEIAAKIKEGQYTKKLIKKIGEDYNLKYSK